MNCSWTRIELKEKAKRVKSKNYKSMVAMSAIITIPVIILFLIMYIPIIKYNFAKTSIEIERESYTNYDIYNRGHNYDSMEEMEEHYDDLMEDYEYVENFEENAPQRFLIIYAIYIILALFIAGPISVGIRRFYMCLRIGKSEKKNIFYVFKTHNYWNVFKVELYKSFRLFLYMLIAYIPFVIALICFFSEAYLLALLFILAIFPCTIPFYIKIYAYRLVEYILAENPDMKAKKVIELSEYLMDGEKKDTFVLDLSFIGWNILAGYTMGILYIFFLIPYMSATNAELYAKLRTKIVSNNNEEHSNEKYENEEQIVVEEIIEEQTYETVRLDKDL